jgi:hypothetical protein
MEIGTYIDLLLKKYRQAPSFPYDDWATDPVSFYALMNLWDEIFRSAAGQMSDFYIAQGDVRMDASSVIFDVTTRDKTRRVDIYAQPENGDFFLATKLQTDGYAPELLHLGHLPDRSELAIQCDLDRDRLIAVFAMIRAYTHAGLPTLDDADALGAAFEKTYRHLFRFPDPGPDPDIASDAGGP